MNHQTNEVIILRIRSLITDKEMVTAQANLDLQRFGEWQLDYMAWHNQIDEKVQELLEKFQLSSPHTRDV